jgi:type I restriction enzyme S subunit
LSQIIEVFGAGPTPTDAGFLHIIESPRPETKQARALLETLWQKTAPFLERGIPNRLRFELHPTFWEMYLTAVLLDQGLPVMANERRRHRGGKGPDIQVGAVEAWFECIAATAGEGPDAVPGYSFEGFAPVPDEAFKLRLTAAIREKFLKHQEYLSKGLVSESEPFVIAVNGGAVPHAYQEIVPPRIIGALFPLGPEAIRFDLRTNTFGDSYFTHQAGITKKSGVSIPTSFFEQEESRGISAVLYSTAEVFNCRGTLRTDPLLIHNPLAGAPLPRGYLRIGRECWRDGKHLVIHDHNAAQAAEAL